MVLEDVEVLGPERSTVSRLAKGWHIIRGAIRVNDWPAGAVTARIRPSAISYGRLETRYCSDADSAILEKDSNAITFEIPLKVRQQSPRCKLRLNVTFHTSNGKKVRNHEYALFDYSDWSALAINSLFFSAGEFTPAAGAQEYDVRKPNRIVVLWDRNAESSYAQNLQRKLDLEQNRDSPWLARSLSETELVLIVGANSGETTYTCKYDDGRSREFVAHVRTMRILEARTGELIGETNIEEQTTCPASITKVVSGPGSGYESGSPSREQSYDAAVSWAVQFLE